MVAIKDYYRILNVESSASAGEIKKSYRRLAMKYHPDRNPEDMLAAAVFADLAEAYKILSNTETRRRYNEERHLTATQEYKRSAETIDVLIQRMQKINIRVRASNPFHLNKDALLYSIKQLFPGDIDLLLKVNADLLKQFLQLVGDAAEHLSSYQTKQLIVFLQPLYIKHSWLQQRLYVMLNKQYKEERWEKHKIVLVIILAIILCVIIFFAASA